MYERKPINTMEEKFIINKTKLKLLNYKHILIILFLSCISNSYENSDICDKVNNECFSDKSKLLQNRYILYDVNPPEGFNLRRDVFMRLAIFAHGLQKSDNKNLNNFKLVLPPWSDLYHWRSAENNMHIPWSQFFDLDSLQQFAPVIEMYQYFNEVGSNYKKLNIEEVYILQNYGDMFETGNFEEKMSVDACDEQKSVKFYNYENITTNNLKCLSFHGHASQLTSILKTSNSRSIFFDHAEIVLHDRYGDQIYWQARRSMRFNKELYSIANTIREKYLNSTNSADNIIVSSSWMDEKPHRTAKGGPYLCVHLRRRDFLWGRPNEIPDLENAGRQIKKILNKNNLSTIFVASDAPRKEYEDLKNILNKYKVIKYTPSKQVMTKYKDGGVAIIEQIICSYAFYFVGTHESTFSYRIQEEREILGFPAERTFNRLCGDNNNTCEKPSVWKIVY